MKSKEQIISCFRLKKERVIRIISTILVLTSLLTLPAKPDIYNNYNPSALATPIISLIANQKLTAVNDPFSFQAFENESEQLSTTTITTTAPKPNDPLYSQQWYLKNTKWGQLYEFLTKDQMSEKTPIIVATIDTGINNHSDFPQEKIFVNSGEIPKDGLDNDGNGYVDDSGGCNVLELPETCGNTTDTSYIQHGTRVASLIFALTNNSKGMASSLDFPITVLPIKTIQDSGIANYSDIYKALQYVIDLIDQGYNIKIVNMSLAGFATVPIPADALIKELYARGVIIIAGSGNSGASYPNTIGWPARLPEVIAVGGSDQNNCRYPSANASEQLDVAAPYPKIMTAKNSNEYSQIGGTSFSTPQVTQLVAILLSINPNLNVEEIKKIIQTTAEKNPNCPAQVGAGIIDYSAAYKEARYPYNLFLPLIMN